MNKQRILWIDMAKGIAMFLVIFAHMSPPPLLKQFIYTFHMPLFFFISGYLFYNTKYPSFKEFLIKKFKSLIIPFFCFSIIAYIPWVYGALQKNIIGTVYKGTLITPILGTLYGIRGNYWGIHNGTMWFLTCLFVTEIMFFLFLIVFKHDYKKVSIAVFICSILGYLYSSKISTELPLNSDLSLTAITFYGIGYFIKRNDAIINKFSNFKVLIILLAVNMFSGFSQGLIDMYDSQLRNYFLFYIAALSGIGWFLILIKKVKAIRIFIYMGLNSILYLILQHIIFPFLRDGLQYIPWLSNLLKGHALLNAIFYTVCIIVSCIPIIYCINNKFYFLLGKSSLSTHTR